MTRGLKSLHDMNIFHRDLKSANIFLSKKGVVKLGDFNVSKLAKKGLLYTQTGTPYYASPEVWKDIPYDQKSDVWSLGCVLYEMVTLQPPFQAKNLEGLYKKVIRGYYPKIPTQYSQDLVGVIRTLLKVQPNQRPTCEKILQLPAVFCRLQDQILQEDELNPEFYKTIKIPKKLCSLTSELPKSNYIPLKTKVIDKLGFLKSLKLRRKQKTLSNTDQSTQNNTPQKQQKKEAQREKKQIEEKINRRQRHERMMEKIKKQILKQRPLVNLVCKKNIDNDIGQIVDPPLIYKRRYQSNRNRGQKKQIRISSMRNNLKQLNQQRGSYKVRDSREKKYGNISAQIKKIFGQKQKPQMKYNHLNQYKKKLIYEVDRYCQQNPMNPLRYQFAARNARRQSDQSSMILHRDQHRIKQKLIGLKQIKKKPYPYSVIHSERPYRQNRQRSGNNKKYLSQIYKNGGNYNKYKQKYFDQKKKKYLKDHIHGHSNKKGQSDIIYSSNKQKSKKKYLPKVSIKRPKNKKMLLSLEMNI